VTTGEGFVAGVGEPPATVVGSLSQRLLKNVVDSIPDPVFMKDLHGRYLLMNAEGLRWESVPLEQILGHTDAEFRSPEIAESLQLHDRQVMATREGQTYEEMFEQVDGTARWVLTTKAPVFDDSGQVAGVVGITRDITARTLADEALRSYIAEIEALYDNAPCGYHSLGPDGRFLRINDTELSWLGYEREEIVGKLRFSDLIAPGTISGGLSFDEAFASMKEIGHISEVEFEVVRKDGTRFSALLTAVAVRDDDGNFVMTRSTMLDITDRRRTEDALRASENELRQAQKMEAIGRLAGGVAHDFNNLLTAIVGFTDLLLKDHSSEHTTVKDLGEIRRAADSAVALTRQLLDFSRGELTAAVPVDLNAVVADIAQLLGRLLGAGIDLQTVLEPDLAFVYGDRGQLEQVIVNLAVNARDAMSGNGTLVIATATAHDPWPGAPPPQAAGVETVGQAPDYVTLIVTDTGTGMDEGTQRRIFEPYFTTKAAGKGTGFGLATVYGIVERLGGHIDVDSRPGAGTRLTVYLPQA
jgi:PAS domain S-box-containing protein